LASINVGDDHLQTVLQQAAQVGELNGIDRDNGDVRVREFVAPHGVLQDRVIAVSDIYRKRDDPCSVPHVNFAFLPPLWHNDLMFDDVVINHRLGFRVL
jgi:hypothetical protein